MQGHNYLDAQKSSRMIQDISTMVYPSKILPHYFEIGLYNLYTTAILE